MDICPIASDIGGRCRLLRERMVETTRHGIRGLDQDKIGPFCVKGDFLVHE